MKGSSKISFSLNITGTRTLCSLFIMYITGERVDSVQCLIESPTYKENIYIYIITRIVAHISYSVVTRTTYHVHVKNVS